MKACSRCQQRKPLTDFYKYASSKDNLTRWCKACTKEKLAAWREKNREHLHAYTLNYNAENKEKRRIARRQWYLKNREKALQYGVNIRLIKAFGITLEQKLAMRNAQNNKCLICDTPFKTNKSCNIDHDHKTGKIRGLLCDNCNTLIGLANENIGVLIKAIAYLKKHSLRATAELSSLKK